MREILKVQVAGRDYPVLCGADASAMLARVWDARWRQAAIVGDANTLPLFGGVLADVLQDRCDRLVQLSFPAGEAHKTRDTKRALEDRLLDEGFDRTCCIVGVGGGIALDVAGFVAATYLRGVSHINVATSLLAQVDAAVGGKTGVNTSHGKNLIGAFHHPWAVLVDTAALTSLPDPELRNGLAEAVKHAVLADAELFDSLEQWAAGAQNAIPPQPLLERCIQIKAEVVEQDEREAAYRQVLNFGHTVAHALETASDHQVQHGAAVAVGMVVEANVARRMCGFPAQHGRRLVALLDRLGLPTRPEIPFAAAREAMGHDKKTRSGIVHCALPRRIGEMVANDGRWVLPVGLDLMEQAWAECGESRCFV